MTKYNQMSTNKPSIGSIIPDIAWDFEKISVSTFVHLKLIPRCLYIINPCPTKPFFGTQITKGGSYYPYELENETSQIHVIGTIV